MENEEEPTVRKLFINTSYGKICYRCAGNKTDPLFLIVHGSGTDNGSKIYESYLYQYLLMYSRMWKIFLVALDCPGYGESTGLRSVIRAFPTKFLQEFMYNLTGKDSCFILMGHSQGGYSIFNAVLSNPNITNFLVQERPVCGDIKRLKDLNIPTLLIYDEEDDGHPIRQGKLIIKMIKNYKFFSYKGSVAPYWVSDNLFTETLKFLYDYRNWIKSPSYTPDFDSITNLHGIEFGDTKNKESERRVMEKISLRNNSVENVPPNEKPSLSKISPDKPKDKKKENSEDKRSKSVSRGNITRATIALNIRPVQLIITEEEKDSETERKIEISNKKTNSNSKEETKTNVKTKPTSEAKEERKMREVSKKEETKKENKIEENKGTIENKKTESLVDPDFKCPLCMDILVYPLVLPCKHVFCYSCTDNSLMYNPCCPMCRTSFEDGSLGKLLNLKNVDKQIEEEMAKKYDRETIEKRKRDVEEAVKRDKARMIKIEYGNTSKKFENNKALKPKYQWVLFVKVISSPVPNVIKFVEFNINCHLPDCKPIKVSSSPYILEKSGTFEFVPRITVHFNDSLKIEPYTTYHRVTLGPEKTSRHFMVYLKK